MATLMKRGKYYYGRWQKDTGNDRLDVRKSLGIRRKPVAQKALEKLENLEEQGKINPYGPSFNPKQILAEQNNSSGLNIRTMRAAADYFYKKKAHLSDKTVKNANSDVQAERGAYERAIEFFISHNDIADLAPRLVNRQHFEDVIFRDIKTPTMWFYFRQLRAFWNKLLEWGIVENNYLTAIKKDMPDLQSNTRPKMVSEEELMQIFKTFDEDLERKRERPDWDESRLQHWFKPMMAVYFYCGLRKNEAGFDSDLKYSGLKGENLMFVDGQLALIYLPATKGRKERSIPIPRRCRVYLRQYLFLRGPIKPKNYVFIYMGGSRKGWPVTGARAYRQFKHYLKLAVLPKSRTLHGMRHERVTTWLENGYNSAEAQYMAGHTSIKTTEGYTHLKGKNLFKKQQELDKR